MSSLQLKAIAAYHIYRKRKSSATYHRRFWVHPIVEQRCTKGAFVALYSKLRDDEEKFSNYFRMSIRSFDDLVGRLEDMLTLEDLRRLPISPTERVAVTIRYLGSGNTFTDLHYSFMMGVSTIAEIVRQVCAAIWTVLKEECMPEPSTHKWREIGNGFLNAANFPNCIGAVDGKHIRLVKPTKSGSLFYNYKNFFSIVLMAVCDSNYCFTFIDVGAYGKNCDSRVFTSSAFWKKMENNTLALPRPEPLPGTQNPLLPYVIVADEAFASSDNVLRPYARKNLNHKKKIFNYRLTRARRFIECSFGILSNKWRIFHRPLNVDVELAVAITKACCILHNFVRLRDGYTFEDTLYVIGFEDEGETVYSNRTGNSVRDKFAEYFVGIGSVPWQGSKVH